MTPTIVLYECIVQRRYLFFVELCFDNIMSIIMKVSYMKSINIIYLPLKRDNDVRTLLLFDSRPYQLFSNEQVCQKCSLAVRRKAIIYIPIHIIFLCFPVTIYISQYNYFYIHYLLFVSSCHVYI